MGTGKERRVPGGGGRWNWFDAEMYMRTATRDRYEHEEDEHKFWVFSTKEDVAPPKAVAS